MKDTRSGIVYTNLSGDSKLSAENETALAELIYDTDPYIYPAMFGSRENAAAVLPFLYYSDDRMFRLDRFYAAVHNGRVIGLLLWVKGRLNWSPEPLRAAFLRAGIRPGPYLDAVAGEYVGKYAEGERDGLISLINLCVAPCCRGKGVGRALMRSFMEQHPGSAFELCVLTGNKAAVHLYSSLGFEITERYNGFSIDHRRLDAAVMRRRVSL